MEQFTPQELIVLEMGLKAIKDKPLAPNHKMIANRLTHNIRAYQSGMPF